MRFNVGGAFCTLVLFTTLNSSARAGDLITEASVNPLFSASLIATGLVALYVMRRRKSML